MEKKKEKSISHIIPVIIIIRHPFFPSTAIKIVLFHLRTRFTVSAHNSYISSSILIALSPEQSTLPPFSASIWAIITIIIIRATPLRDNGQWRKSEKKKKERKSEKRKGKGKGERERSV